LHPRLEVGLTPVDPAFILCLYEISGDFRTNAYLTELEAGFLKMWWNSIWAGMKTFSDVVSSFNSSSSTCCSNCKGIEKKILVFFFKLFSFVLKNVHTTFSGGIPSQGITEIAGESGSGKTQICLQLCLTVQLPKSSGGLNGGK
jgi:hypothetical protein